MNPLRTFIIDADTEELEAVRYWLELDQELAVTALSDEIEALHIAMQNPPDIILLDVKSGDPNGLILCELLRNSRVLDKTMIIGLANEYDAHHTELPERLIHAGSSRFLVKPIDRSITHDELKAMYHGHIQDGWLAREIQEFNERKDTNQLAVRLYEKYMEAWRLSQSIASMKTILMNTRKEAVAGRLVMVVLQFVYRMLDTLVPRLQALDNTVPQSPPWRRNVDDSLRIVRSVQTLLQSTTDTFEKESEKVDLVYLINECVHQHKATALKAGVQIRYPTLQGVMYIRGVPDQLMRLFNNLITNSLEALSNGGQLSIEPDFKNGKITIDFIDNGKGFDDLNRLGMLGYSTKEGRQGIGLFYSKRVAEQHFAEIAFSNRIPPQHGAKVTLTFPLIQ